MAPYVGNNASNATDPSGKFLNLIAGAIGGAIGAVTMSALAPHVAQVIGELAGGQLAHQQLVENHAQAVDVRGCRKGFARGLLGRHVAGCAQ